MAGQGPQDSTNNTEVSYLSLVFWRVVLVYFIYPRLDAGEANKPEMSINGQDPKRLNKSLLCLAKGPEEGQPSKAQNF